MSALLGMFNKKDEAKKKKPSVAVVSDTPVVVSEPPVATKPSGAVRGPFRAGMVLMMPHVTEKTTRSTKSNTYTFIVSPNATKQTVRLAIKQLYGTKPASVNMIQESDLRRQTRFGTSTKRGRKKAMVTMPKGTSIDLSKTPKAT